MSFIGESNNTETSSSSGTSQAGASRTSNANVQSQVNSGNSGSQRDLQSNSSSSSSFSSTVKQIFKEGLASLGPAGGALAGERLGSKYPTVGVVRGSIGGTFAGVVGTQAVIASVSHLPAIDAAVKDAVIGDGEIPSSERPNTPDPTFNHFQESHKSRKLFIILCSGRLRSFF